MKLHRAAVNPASILLFLVALTCTHASAQLPAATVMSVTGGVKVIDKLGKERNLEKGATVNSSEKVVTTDGGLVQLRLNDGGYMSIRPNTEMVIDRFAFDEKNAANSSFLVSLLKGGFRSITGLIGRTNPDAYQIRNGTTTIGIRGTDHEPMFIPNTLPGTNPQGEPGFYDKVNDGETFIRNGSGVLPLKRGQIGFSPVVSDRPPLALQKVPDFYKIELKTDARDPKDDAGDTTRKPASTGMLLRPSLAARKEALLANDATLTTSTTSVAKTPMVGTSLTPTNTTLDPSVTTAVAPLKTLSPTTTLLEPVSTLSTTTLVAPTTSTLSTTSTLTTTTTIAPSTTLIAPTTTITPSTTLVSPASTLIAPTTTTIAPSTTLIAPTTTLIAPTTTVSPTTTIAPTTTILKTPILLK